MSIRQMESNVQSLIDLFVDTMPHQMKGMKDIYMMITGMGSGNVI